MKFRLILLMLFVACCSAGHAQIKLHSTLSDHMVLQQKNMAEIHGTAPKGTVLTIQTSWDNVQRQTKANAQGEWSVFLETPEASYTPHKINIDGGGQELTLSDVLVGEVWLCSGQSNMGMPMGGYPSQPVAESLDWIMTASTAPHLRLFLVKPRTSDTRQKDCEGKWLLSTPQSAVKCSAIGYVFGRKLSTILNVPVGIMVSAYGGSKIESWVTEEVIANYDTADYVTADKADKPHRAPHTLYNGMIHPLNHYPIRGVVWYQGETNRINSHIYASLLTDMINLWRKDRANSELPFIICQLAPYNSVDKFAGARIMEAQMQVMQKVPFTSIAGTSDIGSANFIHAPLKIPVAERVTAMALVHTYQISGLPEGGPVMKSVEYIDNKAIIHYNQTGIGLYPTDKNITCFELAGDDRRFYPATAKVMSDRMTVEVSCYHVSKPVAVRYAFTSWHQTNLYNTAGLPAYPFRTDNW